MYSNLTYDQILSTKSLFLLLRRLRVVGVIETDVISRGRFDQYKLTISGYYPGVYKTTDEILVEGLVTLIRSNNTSS